MGRAKLEIKLIEVEKSRLLTFQKRRRGLTKKISELATLCGISACMICFGPDGSLFSDPFLWPDSQSLNIVCNQYLGIDKAEREKRMLRISDFHATKDEEEEDNQEIASSSNSSTRNSKSVSCDGDSASGGGDGGSRAMRELVEKLEGSSSVELLQQVVTKLDSRLAMVKERIRLLKVESLDLNQPPCGPSEEFEKWEGDFQEID